MSYNITTIDGVKVSRSTKRFPVEIYPEAHSLNDKAIHLGQLDSDQLPSDVMFNDEHQLDPHTMIIDGRDVSVDGEKLDTIESGAEINNLSDQQANSLTSGSHSSWHHHDDWYYRKTQLSTSGFSAIHWGNITNKPGQFNPSPHTHDDRYYTKTELDTGQLDNRYYTETEINTNYYTKSDLDNGQLDNRYYTETEIVNSYYDKSQLDAGQLDDRYYTESEVDSLITAASFGITGSVDIFNDLPTPTDDGVIYIVKTTTPNGDEGFYQWSSGAWSYLAPNTGTTTHNDLPDLNTGDFRHLTYAEYTDLTDGGNAVSHIHDNRYYTESEIDTKLNTKSDIGHDHDNWYYRETEIDSFLDTKSNVGHTHDDRYYTESEIDSLLATKSNVGHLHDDRYYKKSDLQISGGSMVHWGNLTNTPSEFPPVAHNHDALYYRKTELQTSGSSSIHWNNISDKPDFQSNHNHDDRYYVQSEIDSKFDLYYTKAELDTGQLDNRYFTETEIIDNYYSKYQIDNLLTAKSNVGHNHDDRYYTEIETDNKFYNKLQLEAGQLDNRYFTETEINTLFYTKVELNTGQLDSRYYTENEVNALLNTKSDTDHIHDDRYFTETEIVTNYYDKTQTDSLLDLKSNAGHTHDDRYYTESEVDSLIAAASFGITGSVDTYSDLPTPVDNGVIYIVKTTTPDGDEGFYRWDSVWSYLAPNTGTTNHNDLPDLNIGDFRHLTYAEYTSLTGGNNTSLHAHDDRYYTQTESDTLLSAKSDVGHTHDDRYYTKPEIDIISSSYYNKTELDNGQLDNRYYTESEVDGLITSAIDNIPEQTHGSLPDLGNDDHPQYAAHAQNETITGHWDFTSGRLVTPNSDVLPPGSYIGEIFWKSDTDELFSWTGSIWKAVSSSGNSVYSNNAISTNHIVIGDDGQRGVKESQITITNGDVENVSYLHITRDGNEWMRLDHPQGSDLGTVLVYRYTGARTTMVISDKDDGPVIQLQQTGNGNENNPQWYSQISMGNRTQNLQFLTGNSVRFEIESNGTLRTRTSNYENLITNDDDIPNKKYVDDSIITDHGNLTGLSDDDHPHYLTEARHDSLPADNPHSVTLSQVLDQETTTDITVSELELLTDGSDITLHNHDSRYNTKSEITTLLLNKSDIGHTHDDRYYTEGEVDTLLNGKSAVGHNHDDRYYTEIEIDSLLSNKSDTDHNHDERYFTKTEVINNYYDKTEVYNKIELDNGQLDSRYYTENEIDNILVDNYYTITQLNDSGLSQVHWDNITNKPTIGGGIWIDPVDGLHTEINPPFDTTDFIIGDRAIWISGDNHVYELIDTGSPSGTYEQVIGAIPQAATTLDEIGWDGSNYSLNNQEICTQIMNSTLNSPSFAITVNGSNKVIVDFDFKFINRASRGEQSKFKLFIDHITFEYKSRVNADPGNKYIRINANGTNVDYTNYWTDDDTWYNIRIEIDSSNNVIVFYDNVQILQTTTTNTVFTGLSYWFNGGNRDGVIQGICFRNFSVNGELLTGSWQDVYTPVENNMVLVEDDGDGKPAQYMFNGVNWIKISDPDYGNHASLSGLNNDDHPQYLNISRHDDITNNPHQVTLDQALSAQGTNITRSELEELRSGLNTTLHAHDDRYFTETEIINNYYDKTFINSNFYTESEVDNLLNTKSNVSHNHDDRYHTKNYINSTFYTKSQLNSGQLDNRYYTEGEVDTLLNNKSDSNHNHDDRYYTESEIDSLLSNKSDVSHNHDTLYYRKNQVDGLLNTKSDIGHNHDDRYFTRTDLQDDTDSSSGADLIGATPISGGSANTVQSILEELYSQTTSSSKTLDEAYDYENPGDGREITVDSGAVKFNSSSSDYAPLELTNKNNAPSQGLSAGQISVIENELYIYDGSRSKWLTPSKILTFALNNNGDGKLLALPGGMRDWNSGAKMVKDGTIISATIKTSNSVSNKNFYILKNQSTAATLVTDSNGNYLNSNLNVDFSSGDILQIYVDPAGPSTQDPALILEICWRK